MYENDFSFLVRTMPSKLPFEHSDFILQRVFFPLESLLVDDLDGVHLAIILALCQPDLGECSTKKDETLIICNYCSFLKQLLFCIFIHLNLFQLWENTNTSTIYYAKKVLLVLHVRTHNVFSPRLPSGPVWSYSQDLCLSWQFEYAMLQKEAWFCLIGTLELNDLAHLLV